MIRTATAFDLPRLMEWGRRFHAMSGLAAPFDADAAGAVVARLIESPDGVVLVTDHGAIGGAMSAAWCAPEWTMAVELFWWAERDGRALLRGFEAWARDRGAREIRMTTLAAEPRAGLVMRRAGYGEAETSWTKVI